MTTGLFSSIKAKKERREQRIKENKCIICDKKPMEGIQVCRYHRDQKRRINKIYNSKFRYKTNPLCEK